MKFATALFVAALMLRASFAAADPLLTYPLKIKGHTLRTELANTTESRQTGLMFRERMPEDHAMVFVYEVPGRHAMWMKNTLVPLSVAFIDADGRIINIEDMLPQTEDSHAAQAVATYALEVNAGWFKKHAIKKGDRVEGLKALPPSQ